MAWQNVPRFDTTLPMKYRRYDCSRRGSSAVAWRSGAESGKATSGSERATPPESARSSASGQRGCQTADVLCAVGDLVEDVVVWLSTPARRATDTPVRIFHRRGGSAANVATFAAGVAGASRFIGRIGDDALGDRLVAELTAAGVDARLQRAGRSGTIVVLVDPTGERTMLPDRGAATELTTVPVSWLAGVTVLHLPAYSLTVEPIASACVELAAVARQRGIPLSVDASSVSVLDAFGVDRFRALVEQLAPAVLLANVEEAVALGQPG